MRRSGTPSIRLARLTHDERENTPCAGGGPSQAGSLGFSCTHGVSLGGFMGMQTQDMPAAEDAAADRSAAPQHGTAPRPFRSAVSVGQFKCPLPLGARSGGPPRGSLGARKAYAGGTQLLAAIQRRVVLENPQDGPAHAVSELVLYDPEEHRVHWQAQQEAAAAAAATAASKAGGAAAAEAAPAAAAGSDSSVAADSSQLSSPSHPAAGAGATQQPPAAPPTPAQDAMGWDRRVKVFADPFLVQKLRPHQCEGVKFVFECLSGVRQEGVMGAVLADGMGLGKTFQTIASLFCLLTKGIWGPPTCRKPLILCPTSLVQNWGKELRHWLGDRVEPVVVDDTKADKVKKFLQEFRGFSRGNKPKVLVMSYPCFRGHKAEVYKLGIDVLMCDEAHFLKNGEAQITQAVAGLATAKRRLLMSGTPIQNDLSEFHAVFDLACPGLLGTLATFRKTYEGPIQRGRDADATDKQVDLGMQRMNELMALCNRFMLRRTSTVLKSLLPAKVEQVVFCRLSKLQLKLYNHFLHSQPVKALLASTLGEDGKGPPRKRKSTKTAAGAAAAAGAAEGGDQQEQQQEPGERKEMLAPLAAITALKKLCCHPDLIWDMLHKKQAAASNAMQQQQIHALMMAQRRVSVRAGSQMPKSYAMLRADACDDAAGSDDDEAAAAGGNGKAAGKKRTSSKGSGSSTSARQQLTGFEDCEGLFSEQDVYPAYQHGRCQAYHSGKVMVLEALLKSIRADEPTDKVVLVSNYTEVLDVLAVMCAAHKWVALRLDGSCNVKSRQAMVDTFNNPKHPSFVLLLSSKAGGTGLNIIGANRLVLFDPDWNPANDLQAMARVWREGQSKRVWIYRMLMAGSIEEKVLQRQLAKQGLSEALVDEVGQQVRTFSRDELRSLFKVDPAIACETHKAIKCGCDGSLDAMACCKERAAAAAAGGDAAEGILAWAHLARAVDSPDPTWQSMASFVRDNFVTFLFSDHVLDQPAPSPACNSSGSDDEGDGGAAAAAAGGAAAPPPAASSRAPAAASGGGSSGAVAASCGAASGAVAAAPATEQAETGQRGPAQAGDRPHSSDHDADDHKPEQNKARVTAAKASKAPPPAKAAAGAQRRPKSVAAAAAGMLPTAGRRKSAPAAASAAGAAGAKAGKGKAAARKSAAAAAAAAAPGLHSIAEATPAAAGIHMDALAAAAAAAATAGGSGADSLQELACLGAELQQPEDTFDDTLMATSEDDFM